MDLDPLAEARGALARAHDRLEKAAAELSAPVTRVDLVVVYSVGCHVGDEEDWEEVKGWSATAGPKWVHATLLHAAADAQYEAMVAVDDDEDE